MSETDDFLERKRKHKKGSNMQQEWWLWLATLDKQLKPVNWLKQSGKESAEWLTAVWLIPKHMRETQAHVRVEEHKLAALQQLVEQPLHRETVAGKRLNHLR
jgi:hypothetical protein